MLSLSRFWELSPTGAFYKKNKSGSLSHNGKADDMKVTVYLNDGQIFSRTSKTTGKSPLSHDLASVLFDPLSVLQMQPKQRQEVFSAILATDANPEIEKYIADKMQGENIDETYLKLIISGKLDEAKDLAVENRRMAKRNLKDYQQLKKNMPDSLIEVDTTVFDLSKINYREVCDKRTERSADLLTLSARLDSLSDVELYPELIDELEKQLKDHGDHVYKTKIDDANMDTAKARQAMDKAEKPLRENEADLKLWLYTLSALENIDSVCTTCQRILDGESKRQALELAASKIKGIDQRIIRSSKIFQDAKDNYDKQFAVLESLKYGVTEVQKENLNITNRIATMKTALNDAKGIETLKSQKVVLEKKIKALDEIKSKKEAYDSSAESCRDLSSMIDSCQAAINQGDFIDGLLKPDGELRKIASEGLSDLQFDAELTEIWGMGDLLLLANGEIEYNGRALAMASKSEQYQIGILLAELLSRSSGWNFLLIDGLEILTASMRNGLSMVLPKWKNTFDSILFFASARALPKQPRLDWIKFHWVENGTVFSQGEPS